MSATSSIGLAGRTGTRPLSQLAARTSAGLEGRTGATNGQRNSNNAGFIAGTPGTLPDFWIDSATYPLNGITRTMTGPFVESGIPYYEVTYTGTCTAPVALNMIVDGATPPCLAQVGQTWTATVYSMKTAGSYAPLGSGAPVLLICEWRNSTLLATSNQLISDNGVFSQSRTSVVRLFTNAATNATSILIQWNFVSGNVYNFTTRIGGAMIQQTPKATAFLNSLGTVPASIPFLLTSSLLTIARMAMQGRTGTYNFVSNSAFVGAVVGSPGTMPSGLQDGMPASGLVRQIVSTGFQNNIPVITLNYSGTASATTSVPIQSASNPSAPQATIGQTFTASCNVALTVLSGSNPSFAYIEIDELTGAGGFIAGTQQAIAVTSVLTFFQAQRTCNQPTVGSCRGYLLLGIVNGLTYNFNVTISAQQFEQAVAATPLVQTYGTRAGIPAILSAALRAVGSIGLINRAGLTLKSALTAISRHAMQGNTGTSNQLRNSTAQGTVVGSPGTFPTFWGTQSIPAGIVVSVAGYNALTGEVDFSVVGTAGSTSSGGIRFEAIQPNAQAGQTWLASFVASTVSGSPSSPTIIIRSQGAGDTFLSGTATLTTTPTRFTKIVTLSSTADVSLTSSIEFLLSNGVAYNFTVRISDPILRQASAFSQSIKTYGTVIAIPFFMTASLISRGAHSLMARSGASLGTGFSVLTRAMTSIRPAAKFSAFVASKTTASTAQRGAMQMLIKLSARSAVKVAARSTSSGALLMRGMLSIRVRAATRLGVLFEHIGRWIVGLPTKAVIIGMPMSQAKITGSMLMTVHDPIDFVAGDTWELTGPLNDTNGVPLNLAGATITWKLDSISGDWNFLTLTIGSGITIVNMVTAVILVETTAAQTLNLSAMSYRDWLRITLVDGTVLTEWTGVIRVASNPT